LLYGSSKKKACYLFGVSSRGFNPKTIFQGKELKKEEQLISSERGKVVGGIYRDRREKVHGYPREKKPKKSSLS